MTYTCATAEFIPNKQSFTKINRHNTFSKVSHDSIYSIIFLVSSFELS